MKKLLILIFMLTSYAYGEERYWTGVVSIDQSVSENISLIQARAIATEKAKVKASSMAGAYIIKTEKIENEIYSESIEVIGAAMVSIESETETVSLQNGNTVLHLTIGARVDLTELQRRLSYVKDNQNLREFIASQNREIVRLIERNSVNTGAMLMIPVYRNQVARLFSGKDISVIERNALSARANNEAIEFENTFGYVLKNGKINARIENIYTADLVTDGEIPAGFDKVLEVRVDVDFGKDVKLFLSHDTSADQKLLWIDLDINNVVFRKIVMTNRSRVPRMVKNLLFDKSSQSWYAMFKVRLTPYIYNNYLLDTNSENRDLDIKASFGVGDRIGVYEVPGENAAINGTTLFEGTWDRAPRHYVDPLEIDKSDYLWIKNWYGAQ